MAFLRIHKLTEKDEIGYFAPRTWDFWRALIVCFCLCCILGHWLEMPYCWLMDRLFGIVADDYAVWPTRGITPTGSTASARCS